jgi:hypothetical protein
MDYQVDKGYPLLFWIMTPYKDGKHHLGLEFLYNQKHKRGKLVAKNEFGIMKQIFKELFLYKNLHITIVPYVFNVCYLFHNLILGEKEIDVEELMHLIQFKGMQDYALNVNGLHQFEEKVCILGKELLRQYNH